MDVYGELKRALREEIERNGLAGKNVSVRCRALTPKEAIGTPDHDDYPIIKGREVMVEAEFEGARGQAFTDAFREADYSVEELAGISLDSNKDRAVFVAGLNAVFRYLRKCDMTVHCKDREPKECADQLTELSGSGKKVLLIGYQPRFLQMLAAHTPVRVIDLDADNIGAERFGVVVEPPTMTTDALNWCDTVFATGSTLVNGTITTFLDQDKPVVFYGVTIAAAATILDLNRYCRCGH